MSSAPLHARLKTINDHSACAPGLQDLGLFSQDEIETAVTSITFPTKEMQRRVKFPKGMRRKDKQHGVQYCSDSDTQHSTGSETSFDYEEVQQELLEEVYTQRQSLKRRADKGVRGHTHTRKHAPHETS